MLPHLVPDRAPNPAAHRRFRLITGVLAILVAVVLALQYTAHAPLPASKNDALWGVLVGIVGMGLLLDWQWTAAARRRPRGR